MLIASARSDSSVDITFDHARSYVFEYLRLFFFGYKTSVNSAIWKVHLAKIIWESAVFVSIMCADVGSKAQLAFFSYCQNEFKKSTKLKLLECRGGLFFSLFFFFFLDVERVLRSFFPEFLQWKAHKLPWANRKLFSVPEDEHRRSITPVNYFCLSFGDGD